MQGRSNLKYLLLLPSWALILASASGCGKCSGILGNSTDQEVIVAGNVIFTEGVTLTAGKRVLIQYSQTEPFFATDTTLGQSIDNEQGFISLPYQFAVCAPSKSSLKFTVRAFQDSNENSSPDTGESFGRNDGTATGNTTYLSQSGDTTNSRINIFLDATTP